MYRFYEGSLGVAKRGHEHRFRAVAKGLGPDNSYLVLSSCADCSATKVDDINPDNKTRLLLQKKRRGSLLGRAESANNKQGGSSRRNAGGTSR